MRRSRYAGAGGVAVAFIANEVAAKLEGVDDLVGSLLRLEDGTVVLPMILLLGWTLGRGTFFGVHSRGASAFPESPEVDLMNLDEIRGLGRSGLRHALAALVGIAIVGLIFLGTAFGLGWALPVFLVGIVTGLTFLLRPALRARDLVREAKQSELARIEPMIREVRDEVLSGGSSNDGRLTDLITYRTSIEATPEWPFDPPMLARFGLYLLIPVVSMVCGALVERAVDALLD